MGWSASRVAIGRSPTRAGDHLLACRSDRVLTPRSTFCNAFYSGSLERMTTPSIVFILFINLALCITFTILAFFTARPPKRLERVNGVLFKRVNKEECVAMCFCCPAKTQGMSSLPSSSDSGLQRGSRV